MGLVLDLHGKGKSAVRAPNAHIANKTTIAGRKKNLILLQSLLVYKMVDQSLLVDKMAGFFIFQMWTKQQ